MAIGPLVEELLQRWGAWAIFLGAALEGESAVVAGGAIAGKGLVAPWLAGVAAGTGSFLADQLCYWIGRRFQRGRIVRWAERKTAFRRAIGFIDRHPTGFVLAFRFIYGFRIAGPIAIGVSHVPPARFLLLNAISAAIWASLFTALGFLFGRAIEHTVERFGWPLLGLAVALLAGAAGWWLLRRRRRAGRIMLGEAG